MPIDERRLYKPGVGAEATPAVNEEVEVRALTVDDIEDATNESFESGRAQEIFNKVPDIIAEGVEKQGVPSENQLYKIIAEAEAENGQIYEKFKPDENPFSDIEPDKDITEGITAKGMSAMKDIMQAMVVEQPKALMHGDVVAATHAITDGFDKYQELVGPHLPEGYVKAFNNAEEQMLGVIDEYGQDVATGTYKFVCGACDFIPVAGPGKMCIESVAGKTLGGDDLEGWGRFWHGAEGVVFLCIDCTGVGAVGTKLAKGGVKGVKVGYRGAKLAPKLITRTAALLRYYKAPRKVSKSLFRVGTTLSRHPKLAEKASKGIVSIAKAREARKLKLLPGALKDVAAQHLSERQNKTAKTENEMMPNAIANANLRDGMDLIPANQPLELDTNAAGQKIAA
ncbi:MAG: hypothetical protein Q8P90_00890 [bacterium]|nr:hypothetical protein [bacterium]